ncbi:MAG: rhodanese-like domain-containing protein [Putridiphycobacter sp.]
MKNTIKYFTLLAGFTFLVACGNTKEVAKEETKEVVEEVKETGPIYKNVNAEEFKSLMSSNPGILLDVRTAQEFGGGYIPGAINIDYYSSTFKDEVSKLDKTKPIYVYCRSGARSGKSMIILQELGFNEVYNLIGGYMNYPKPAPNPHQYQRPLETK